MRIEHVQLSIGQGKLAEARDFYTKVLGLREIIRPDGLTRRPGFWTRLEGGQELHISEDPGADPSTLKAHVAFAVTSVEDLKRRLTAAGTKWEAGAQMKGSSRFHFRDPFGNRIEVIEHQAVATEESTFDVAFPAGDLERILDDIERRVQALLDNDPKKLTNWLYRLDVPEKSTQGIFKTVIASKWAQRIAELIFQRELQKYCNQRKS